MAKFDKVKTNASEVAKTEAVKAEKTVVENILIENLIPDPNNNEDVSVTSDLERSITKNGFLDPIVVTTFGMEEGKYRIVSGHRRTEAMKKLKKTAIPAFVQNFNSEEEVANARQSFNNATRDSAKDPLLMVRRWQTWDATHSDMKETEKVEEFAKDCGMSTQTVQRYKSLAKIIKPILEISMVEERVGYSSILPLATFKAEEQTAFYNIMVEALNEDDDILTRPFVKKMIDAFKGGAKTWADIKAVVNVAPTTVSHGENTTTDDFSGMNAPENGGADEEPTDNSDSGKGNDKGNEDSDFYEEEEEPTDNEEAKRIKNGETLKKLADKLEKFLNGEFYSFKSDEDARECVNTLMSLCQTLVVSSHEAIDEMGEGGFDVFMALKSELKATMDNCND